jgi:DNA-binding NarL/FixJ family response regulator
MGSKVIYIAGNQYLWYIGLSQVFKNFYGSDACIEFTPTMEILQFAIEHTEPAIIAIDYQNFDFTSDNDFFNLKVFAPTAAILVVSENSDGKQLKDVLKLGISYYIYKSSPEESFTSALKAIQNKRKFICSELYETLLQKDKKTHVAEIIKLSNCEVEIVRFIADGKTTKEIAEIKHLSFHTINSHRKNIFRKLNINNSSELIKYANNNDIINDMDYYI